MWRRLSARAQVGLRTFLMGSVLAVIAATFSLPSPVQRPATIPVSQAPDAQSAVLAARLQGSPVEVGDQRTPTRTVFANPNGTMTAELTVVPTRVKRGNSWVAVDTTVAPRGDGAIGPKAAVGDLALSAGGSEAPLARMVKDGKSFALYWPGELPVPRVTGNAATYPDVLPGVDLTMYAETNGYRQHLVIKTPEAARNPALARIRFQVETSGLRLVVADSGVLTAVDESGEPVFVAPPSLMWDSSGGSVAARSAPVGLQVRDGSLVLSPDTGFLADAAAVFPIVVDPDMRTSDKSNWASAASGRAGTSYWWRSAAPNNADTIVQVGQCYNGGGECGSPSIGAVRAFFQYDTSFVAGRRVLGAELKSVVVYSPNCSDRAHQVWRADRQIEPGMSWNNNMPQGVSGTDYASPPVYVNGNCGGHKPIGVGTINTGGVTTYLFNASNEGDQLAWRKLDPAQTKLSVTFNTGPFKPSELSTDPPLPAPCRWCAGESYIGDEFIRFRARLSDPDNDQVKPKWITTDNGTEFVDWGVLQNSGATHDINIDLRNRHNHRMRWQVQAWDTLNGNLLDASDWAFSPSAFVVDRVGVTVPPTVSGVLYREDNRWHGGAGVPDTFTFGANGVGDIDHYLWGWSDPPTNKVNAATRLGDNASVQLTPPGDGPRDLFVQSVDRAGHRSPTRVYHFFVRAGSGPLAHWSLDGNANDTAFLGDRHGTVSGPATFGPGAVDTAIQMSQDASTTAPPVVRTDASFSVSAWVRLTEGTVPRVAVSQVDSRVAGFELSYRPENGGRWAFLMPRANTDNPAIDMAASAQPAQLNTWTHLTGVYDATTNQQRLYVNGAFVGTATHTSRWHAASDSRIGATRWNGSRDAHWRGAIDEVQIYDRVVSDPEIAAAVSRDNVPAGSWQFDDERTIGSQPNTIARNSVDGASPGSLTNGATFTDQGAVKGALALDGVDDHVLTDGPAVRTDQSFSVAAWVKADRLAGNHLTAVAQLGVFNSGFHLQYNGGHQRWLFLATSADGETATLEAAVSAQQPVAGQWTHLAGVYDATAQRLRIYVNGALGGTSGPWSMSWSATGPVAVGRGMWRGGPAEHWPGSIDEVRLYSRALSDADVRAIVSQDNVTAGTWKLDGNADDSSGRNLHGTVGGGPQWTPGQSQYPDSVDSAVTLDGSDDHVRTPPAVDTSKSFSVSAWAKLNAKHSGWSAVISQNGTHTSAFNLGYAGSGADRWAFAMHGSNADDPSSVTRVYSAQQAQQGVWTHLAAVFNAVTGEMRLYVNGTLSATGTISTAWNATSEFDIGRARWRSNWVDYLPGTVDDVIVYNRPLFSEEVRALAGRDLSLVHNWRLDETTGPAADAIGARAATPTGGATFGPGRVGNSIRLDGVDDVVSTTGLDLRTDQSYAVAAWVYLDSADRTATAVSVDGAQFSKFRLGHVVDSDHRDGAWVFECPEPDGTVTEAAVSRLPGEVGTWVHLVGVYDAQTRRIWLYVNGNRIDDGRLNTAWHAGGGLQVGRGKANGAPADFWPGRVDDVRLYTDALDRDRVRVLHESYPRS